MVYQLYQYLLVCPLVKDEDRPFCSNSLCQLASTGVFTAASFSIFQFCPLAYDVQIRILVLTGLFIVCCIRIGFVLQQRAKDMKTGLYQHFYVFNVRCFGFVLQLKTGTYSFNHCYLRWRVQLVSSLPSLLAVLAVLGLSFNINKQLVTHFKGEVRCEVDFGLF